MEFYKWLHSEAKEIAMEIINKIWNESWFLEANVVTLCKKGNVEDPANYRPISLLQSIYKIYAGLIKNKLSDTIDERSWDLQYGFRGKKSTAQAMVVFRRLQDINQRSDGEALTLIFLDWEKAFDKVDQEELLNTIKRLNVTQTILDVLKTFCDNPRLE